MATNIEKKRCVKQVFGAERLIRRSNYVSVMKIVDDGTAKLVMHPARFNILQCLSKASEPLFVEQIAKAVNEHPRLVSHHLNILQEAGLVDCKYEIANPKGSMRGVAVRLCSPTPKLTAVLNDIAKAVAEVK
jgi:DNA-binding transcriptional ArsR family regulator